MRYFRFATGFFIPLLTFPCSHFLDSGGKQERLKEEGGLKKNKTDKTNKKAFCSLFNNNKKKVVIALI